MKTIAKIPEECVDENIVVDALLAEYTVEFYRYKYKHDLLALLKNWHPEVS
jgi:hypothetical protein